MFSTLSSKWSNTQVQDKNKLYVLFCMKYGVQYGLISKEEKKSPLNSPTAFSLKIKLYPAHLNNFRLPFTPQL